MVVSEERAGEARTQHSKKVMVMLMYMNTHTYRERYPGAPSVFMNDVFTNHSSLTILKLNVLYVLLVLVDKSEI